jgi:hypothetical protein
VGKGVPKLVRVQVLEAGLRRPAPRHLADTAWGHRATASEPQVLRMSLWMRSPHAEVPIESLRRAVSDPDEARSSSLRLDEQERQLVEVGVLNAKSSNLGDPTPVSIKMRTIAASRRSSKPGPSQAFSRSRSWSSPRTAGGDSGTLRGLMFASGKRGFRPPRRRSRRSAAALGTGSRPSRASIDARHHR